jgi:putative transposase
VIQCQLKLKLTKRQERELDLWLYHLTSVWNWAVRKIELDARDGIYYSEKQFHNLLAGHSAKLGIPSHVLQGTLSTAHKAWRRRFKQLSRKPRFKGQHNKLNSIPFPDPLKSPRDDRVTLLGIRTVRFHRQELPDGKIKCGRIVKRASGWYLCLFIDAEPNAIPRSAGGQVGIDPGFNHLLSLSSGEKIQHPRELEASAQRLGQAQRGTNRKLTARISERIANKRKDRNHKLSRRLVSENVLIAFSADRHSAIARRFGKSVASSGHHQLRSMLSYKSRAGGTTYVEPDSKNSTRTCSACGALSGPSGWAGLKVREWDCGACGAHHDRDINAGMNALIAGAGLAHETLATAA